MVTVVSGGYEVNKAGWQQVLRPVEQEILVSVGQNQGPVSLPSQEFRGFRGI